MTTAEGSKTYGDCPLCDKYGPLTVQHVKLVPQLKGHRIMICRSCHDIVSRYEGGVQKLLKHLAMPED